MDAKKSRSILSRAEFWLGLILLGAAGWKLILLSLDAFPFNSDEAIVALMARHILQGERPIFFYGQAYMGSLDAYLAAFGFAIFGQQVWVIRLIQMFFYLGTIITTVLIGRVGFRAWEPGLFAGILLAFPTVNATLYTTVSLGGYGEALLLGVLSLLLGLLIRDLLLKTNGLQLYGFLGIWSLIAGLGLWTNALSYVFILPGAFVFFYPLLKTRPGWKKTFAVIGVCAAGFFIGSFPWWWHAFQNGFYSLIGELAGSAVSVESGSFFARLANHFINLLIFGSTVLLGVRPPWDVQWLALPLFPLVLVFWIVVGIFTFRFVKTHKAERGVILALAEIAIIIFAAFLFTSFGVDPSGRYFLPLIVPMALFGGLFLSAGVKKPTYRFVLIVLVVGFHGWGTLETALVRQPGITTQFDQTNQVEMADIGKLQEFLLAKNERNGYTNYWIAYPLAFLSGEELIYVPRLPYHQDLRYTSRDNRYPAYSTQVEKAEKIAYITSLNPNLDQKMQAAFIENSISWKEEGIGDFRVYYDLSRVIRPEELGLSQK